MGKNLSLEASENAPAGSSFHEGVWAPPKLALLIRTGPRTGLGERWTRLDKSTALPDSEERAGAGRVLMRPLNFCNQIMQNEVDLPTSNTF